jgi:hypothetical protein
MFPFTILKLIIINQLNSMSSWRLKKTEIFLFFIINTVIQLSLISSLEINCRKCGSKITDSSNLINHRSNQSINSFKKEIFTKSGVLTHTFKNPSNKYFELITAESSTLTCDKRGYEAHTFFPGYDWSICVCPVCSEHHGWMFSRIDKYCGAGEIDKGTCGEREFFFGLSVENLSHSDEKQIEKIEF